MPSLTLFLFHSHGYTLDIYHRHELLKGLYDNLSDDNKAKILVNKKVTSIETSASSVRVHCADGTVEEGDMVIGADGVHSTTRQITRQLALEAGCSSDSINAEKPWMTNYRVLYGNMPRTLDLMPGHAYESHGSGNCMQLFIGQDRAWFFVYSALQTPTREPARYTQQDADEYASVRGDLHLTPTMRLRDVYAKKHASGLTNLEEGVMKHWGWGRIVLAGDAAHKITPNIGWGFNSSVHDLVVLVNGLRASLLLLSQKDKDKDMESSQEQEQEHIISTSTLEELFAKYQAERMAHINQTNHLSGTYTRVSAWRSTYRRLLDYYVFPNIHADDILVSYGVGAQIRTVPVLDWLDEPHFSEGRIPWECVPLDGGKTIKARQKRSRIWDLIEAVMPTVISLL